MTSKAKPYERFGSYLLFKKLESDPISELWRAAEINGQSLGSFVFLRRFTGGNHSAIRASAEHARAVVSALTGTTVVKGQKVGFVGETPFLTADFATSGRTLKTILDRAAGGGGATANPIPIDQALAVVEKLASSCEMLSSVKYQGARIVHSALIPQFVWISEEGEVRAGGQQFGKGLLASLNDPATATELGGYFAPELRAGGEATKASDVYSLGALLFLMLTGKTPSAFTDAGAIRQALGSAQLAQRKQPIPADIRPILEKTLQIDPAARYPSSSEMRTEVEKLLNGGEYTPTTFNLAFYLHSLLKKDIEQEETDRAKEEATDVQEYTQAPAPAPVAAPRPAPPRREIPSEPAQTASPFSSLMAQEEEKKSKAPMIAAAAIVLLLGGGGAAWYAISNKPVAKTVAAAAVTPAPAPAPAPIKAIEPIVASAPTSTATSTAPTDPNAREKAIEDAVQKKLQEEMMKMQENFNKDLQKKQQMAPSVPPPTTVATTTQAPTAPVHEENAPSAAELDQQRRAQTSTSAPPTATASVASNEQTAPPEVVAPVIRDGDLVAVNDLDSIPELRAPVRPVYPPMAVKRNAEGTVIVSVLINENGQVSDVRILRGDKSGLGFDDAAIRAVRAASFTPPVKSGHRVKTWKPLPIIFKLK